VIFGGNISRRSNVMMSVKTIARLLSLAALGFVPDHRPTRGSSRVVDDEQFEVLETGVLWDETNDAVTAAVAHGPRNVT
jgi:hypothetical protein